MSLLKFSDIAKIFEELELKLIASLKRNLSRHKAWEKEEGFNWSAWQAEKLKNIDNFRQENRKILGEYTDVIDKETRSLMEDQFKEGEKLVNSQLEIEETAINEAFNIKIENAPKFFGINDRKMKTLIENVTQLEKDVSSAALRMTDDVYRQMVNRVQLEMGTGGSTLTQAIDSAVKDFLDKGINCIVYKDRRRVNIADYVRMVLCTTSTRATLQGQAKRFAELGYDTVIVSQYGGCSETCLPWQGQVYIDDVFTIWEGERDEYQGKSNYCGEWFWLLSYAVKNGLFHPNCRHTMSQYIHGVTEIPKPIPAERMKKQRELEQKQRYLERKIRKFKRFQVGSCDPETAKAYGKKVREVQAELRELIKANEPLIKRDYEREKVYDGEVDKTEKRGIIKADKVIFGHDNAPKKYLPNAVVDHINSDNKVSIRTFYDSNSMKSKDIHTNNHGNPKTHNYGSNGEHAHDYEWDTDGKLKNKTTRELTDLERKENSDIL